MFLKRIRAASKEGKRRTYWALVKSVRTARGPRHQVVSYLGELQAAEKSEWANLARIVNKRPLPRMPLFETVEATEPVPETIEVRVRGARVERTRDFGNVDLALTLWRTLELDQLLERIKTNDVVLPTSNGRDVRIRCVTQTDESQRILLGRLGLKIPTRLGEPQWSSDAQM